VKGGSSDPSERRKTSDSVPLESALVSEVGVLRFAQQQFCERYGVTAPHEAIERRLASVLDWCHHLDSARRPTPSPQYQEGCAAAVRDGVSCPISPPRYRRVTGRLLA
jgi:hypothetical protein